VTGDRTAGGSSSTVGAPSGAGGGGSTSVGAPSSPTGAAGAVDGASGAAAGAAPAAGASEIGCPWTGTEARAGADVDGAGTGIPGPPAADGMTNTTNDPLAIEDRQTRATQVLLFASIFFSRGCEIVQFDLSLYLGSKWRYIIWQSKADR